MAPKTRKPPGQNISVTKAAWYEEIVGNPDEPPPDRLAGRDLRMLEAMEDGGPDAVRALIESWGLVWVVGPRGGLTVDLPEDRKTSA
ncbi:hypothetical protein OS965_34545 [Streptomyces sp. H27-G5]|uniref:hypothetical protein n=1 Tax=Streptomyces sp. H27-G5 TaxID=2996698 RepID=UPI002271F86A|nr:hypothetical protein [Streptomyces sp. H27-G5]MCY0923199.1 hypothetical protein [Streptomyces sp. H27-G5]